jgi:hypothetical protein
MFRRNIASAIADLTLWADGNWKNSSTVATVGENPSAKGRLPLVDSLLTKIPLIYYVVSNSCATKSATVGTQARVGYGNTI